jgi:hypothetical protein
VAEIVVVENILGGISLDGICLFFLVENIILTPSALLVPLRQGDNILLLKFLIW